jgi:hypothetical protein
MESMGRFLLWIYHHMPSEAALTQMLLASDWEYWGYICRLIPLGFGAPLMDDFGSRTLPNNLRHLLPSSFPFSCMGHAPFWRLPYIFLNATQELLQKPLACLIHCWHMSSSGF